MKVLIQNPDTSLYLEAPERRWSSEIQNAFDFGNSDEAIAFCSRHRIAPVQIVLQWEGTPNSLTIPVLGRHVSGGEKIHRARRHA